MQRNRLKRVTREALRELHPDLRPGYDLVVIIRGTVEELPGSAEAQQLLTRMLRRAGLLDPATARDGEQTAMSLSRVPPTTIAHRRRSTMAPRRCCRTTRRARRRGWRC